MRCSVRPRSAEVEAFMARWILTVELTGVFTQSDIFTWNKARPVSSTVWKSAPCKSFDADGKTGLLLWNSSEMFYYSQWIDYKCGVLNMTIWAMWCTRTQAVSSKSCKTDCILHKSELYLMCASDFSESVAFKHDMRFMLYTRLWELRIKISVLNAF